MRVSNMDKLVSILTQCKDTLEWQVGTGIPVVDFVYPKLLQALNLIAPDEDEDDSLYTERTTGDELRAYTYDFVPSDED
jgi:hypothetical protein